MMTVGVYPNYATYLIGHAVYIWIDGERKKVENNRINGHGCFGLYAQCDSTQSFHKLYGLLPVTKIISALIPPYKK